ncbi:F-box protein-like [Rhynchospora pubera]|uniref:F-box protein-like n=1 Tax=Rhynchospora pubera TaxID=906938 RepID=A0AAV8GNC8_9POAL|nr:F-box protein-like [Rhynchospora pubera]KAJ4804792.1 F-box protein-like [Rhynchospora pubera]
MAAAEPMGGADRISALPVDIKISILSLLDLNDAIRTSALARSWRPIWTLLPCLHLGLGNGNGLGLGLDNHGLVLLPGDSSRTVSSDWIERAHHLVSSLRGPLDLFELTHRFTSDQSPLIERLLDLVLQKGGLETLHLYCLRRQILVHLPPFHSLKALHLSECHVLLPNGFQGFRSLTTLELEGVQISNNHLHILINASNNLTTFLGSEFLVSEHPLSVSITSPLLRHLTFRIDCSVEKVSVISAPSLEQVEIRASYSGASVSKKLAPVVLGLLLSVAMVSSLNLEYGALTCLSRITLPFNFAFPQLRSLMVNFEFYPKTTCDAFLWLLKSMPFVEELKVELSYWDRGNWDEILKEELLGKKQDGISCLNQTLKSVTIYSYNVNHVMIGITLGKFFLLNTKVLKLMKFQGSAWSIVKPGMIEELQKAEAASSDARVVIFCHEDNGTINIK